MPEDYDLVLEAGLRSMSGVVLSRGQRRSLDEHVRLLLAWNRAINLSGIREPGPIAREHVLDSLTGLPTLRDLPGEEFLDLGSGAGYPGIPLAIGLPSRRAMLVESTGKKARFLAVVVDALGLAGRVRIAATRAETLAADPHHRGRWPVVVARAVEDLAGLAELSLPLLRTGGSLVAWKRSPIEDELEGAEPALARLGGRLAGLVPVAVPGLEDHLLAIVEKVAATPPGYPRDPAARRSRG